ncbi:MAG: BLUF domain-containing protein [Pseudomonadota bacterium]
MIQVSYVSRTAAPMSDQDLLALLLECQEKNRSRGITGLLLYANGTFLQAIEGEESVIDSLVEKIWGDPRHRNVKLLQRRPVSQREYKDWSMGFERVTDEELQKIEGLREFGVEDFTFDQLASDQDTVESLMQHYREPHFDQVLGEVNAMEKVINHLSDALAQVRERAQVARLALEAVTDAVRKEEKPENIVAICEAAISSLRPR